jgi:hypothetical protein
MKIHNLSKVSSSAKYLVCRFVGEEVYAYGGYDDLTKAEFVAEFINGFIVTR